MEKRRVVITGIGAMTPIGHGAEASWRAACRGENGIAPITLYDASAQKAKLAGEVKDFDPAQYIDKRDVRKMDRYTQLAMAAAKEAFEDSELDMEGEDPYRCGIMVSSGIGGFRTLQDECLKGEEKGYDRVSPFFIPMVITNIAAGYIAIKYGFKGQCSAVVAACAGGGNAIGDAFRYIRDGYADVMITGGAEATVTSFAMGGFTSMRALSLSDDPARASIPFDKERSGFVMGEGSGIIVIETLEHALARGAKIYAELIGFGATCDAYHITAPAPGGAENAECLRQSILDAGISPKEVGYINAHGTSTPLNDASETSAVKQAFGEHAKKLMVSSTKSMTGHMLGAAGAVEAIFTACALRDGFVPPTINYKVPDEECDLDYVPNTGRKADLTFAISNSLGFGGHNTSLVLKKWEGR